MQTFLPSDPCLRVMELTLFSFLPRAHSFRCWNSSCSVVFVPNGTGLVQASQTTTKVYKNLDSLAPKMSLTNQAQDCSRCIAPEPQLWLLYFLLRPSLFRILSTSSRPRSVIFRLYPSIEPMAQSSMPPESQRLEPEARLWIASQLLRMTTPRTLAA